MESILKKAKVVRKTFKERLEETRTEAWREGHRSGYSEGEAAGRREFLPPYDARASLLDLVRVVEGWPVKGDALVAIVATDLKYVCNAVIPVRTMQIIASEMKKRLA